MQVAGIQLVQRWCGHLAKMQSSVWAPLLHETSTTADMNTLNELVIQLADLARDIKSPDAKCGWPKRSQKFDAGLIESTVEKTGTLKDTIIYLWSLLLCWHQELTRAGSTGNQLITLGTMCYYQFWMKINVFRLLTYTHLQQHGNWIWVTHWSIRSGNKGLITFHLFKVTM